MKEKWETAQCEHHISKAEEIHSQKNNQAKGMKATQQAFFIPISIRRGP